VADLITWPSCNFVATGNFYIFHFALSPGFPLLSPNSCHPIMQNFHLIQLRLESCTRLCCIFRTRDACLRLKLGNYLHHKSRDLRPPLHRSCVGVASGKDPPHRLIERINKDFGRLCGAGQLNCFLKKKRLFSFK